MQHEATCKASFYINAWQKVDIVNITSVPDAIDLLAEWHHEEWSYLNPSLSLAQRKGKMKNYFSAQFIPSAFIAKHTQILGSAAIVECDMDTHKYFTPWLASVFVTPAKRRQGIGSALVRHVMREANKHGVEKLYLFTPDQQKFYQKLGWTHLFRENYRGNEVHIMCAELK